MTIVLNEREALMFNCIKTVFKVGQEFGPLELDGLTELPRDQIHNAVAGLGNAGLLGKKKASRDKHPRRVTYWLLGSVNACDITVVPMQKPKRHYRNEWKIKKCVEFIEAGLTMDEFAAKNVDDNGAELFSAKSLKRWLRTHRDGWTAMMSGEYVDSVTGEVATEPKTTTNDLPKAAEPKTMTIHEAQAPTTKPGLLDAARKVRSALNRDAKLGDVLKEHPGAIIHDGRIFVPLIAD